jgi:hypothetical protein
MEAVFQKHVCQNITCYIKILTIIAPVAQQPFHYSDLPTISIHSVVTRLRAGRSRIRISVGARGFYLLQIVPPALGSTQPSIRLVPGVKWPGREATYLHLVPKIRMSGAVPLFPYMHS